MATAASETTQFARLLKKSKFATFDPSVARVYTSHGGYAHRGDYGLKRPLPASARRGSSPLISIQAIDSPVMQTEWKTAENQGKWIRRFDETGAGAASPMNRHSSWSMRFGSSRNWEIQSSYDASSAPARALARTPPALPNYRDMSEPEFQAYLEDLRKLHPEFHRWFNAKRQKMLQNEGFGNSESMKEGRAAVLRGSWQQAKQADMEDYWEFLNEREYERGKASEFLNPVPHPNAGLSYSSNGQNKAQHQHLYPTVPARLIRTGKPTRFKSINDRIALGGVLADTRTRAGTIPANPSRDALDFIEVAKASEAEAASAGEIDTYFNTVAVHQTPNVVGHHNGLGGTAIYATASTVDAKAVDDMKKPHYNPHPIGTAEYVGHLPAYDRTAQDTAAQRLRGGYLSYVPREGKQSKALAAATKTFDALLDRITTSEKPSDMP